MGYGKLQIPLTLIFCSLCPMNTCLCLSLPSGFPRFRDWLWVGVLPSWGGSGGDVGVRCEEQRHHAGIKRRGGPETERTGKD